jgi:RHS repeat-associated protein
VTNPEYDDLHRLKKVIHPAATAGAVRLFETVEYDAAGNVTRRTDTAGRATLFEYDAADRLTKVSDPASQATQYEYNARSETTAVVDALGQRYEFAYDKLGRVTQTTRAGASMTFAYDAAGNRTERRDYNGALTTYAYDALNRLTGVSYPDTTSATYGYDKLSRLTSATNQHGTVTLSYNSAGQLSGTTDVWGQTLGYQYDANDNRTELRLGGTVKATYQYDALNRLTVLTDGGAFAFAYDAAGKPTSRTSPNGVATTYEYDGLDRLTKLRHAKGTTTLAEYQHQLSAAGTITQITDAAGAHAYAYDAADRLTSATHPSAPAESYAYDGVGNRTASHRTTNYQYQTFNRVVTAGPTTYTYDANGNLTAKSDGVDSWTYAWDAENRLTTAAKLGGPTVTYKYDALGRRVQRVKSVLVPYSVETTSFSYDGADVVLDTNGDGSTVEYVNGLGVDEKLALRAGGVTLHYAQDHLGSMRALTDASGNVVEQQTYDSFGDGPGSLLTRYGFTGRERDADTGLYYYRARWYDPQAGRFISEDPIGFEGGVNWYEYVGNNPLSRVDPFGEDWQDDWLTNLANASAGFGDTISLGITRMIRRGMGIDSVVDPCSPWYSAGEWGGLAHALAMGGGAGVRNAMTMGLRNGGTRRRLLTGAQRFFRDPRRYDTVRKQYWRRGDWGRGPANNSSLHHWWTPQRDNGPNAGWNLMELPRTFNSWMNDTTPARRAVERGLRVAVPGAFLASATQGGRWGMERAQWKEDCGCK